MSLLFETYPASAPITGYAQVALEQGVDIAPDGLTYGIPAPISDLQIGERVIVPLGRGNKPTTGYITAIDKQSDLEKVKPIKCRDPRGISLTSDLIELARWLGAYYCCPLGMVFATMLPAAVKRGIGRVVQLQVRLSETELSSEIIKLTKLQKKVLEASRELADKGVAWVEHRRLADYAGAKTVTPVKQLIDKQVLIARRQMTVRASSYDTPKPEAATRIDDGILSDAQRHAIEQIIHSAERGFSVHLLHGVTGSGKTEVYLRVLESVCCVSKNEGNGNSSRQLGAIILVPEIALTPQTVARFEARFDDVAVLHSALTSSQRHEQWRRIRDGHAKVVVGARSAIFAPLPHVGLIIVDEEHDTSYKQDQLPRYHARDVAVRRAQILGIPVVLGSATPSLESYHNATAILNADPIKQDKENDSLHQHIVTVSCSRYNLLQLPNRITGFELPKVQIVDMVEERRSRRGVHLLSRRLEDLLKYTLRQKSQALLLLNRRGFANYIACPDQRCGWLMSCEFCDASVVYHKDKSLPSGGYVQCHHCGAEQLLPRHCPICRKRVTTFGLGTQRVEEEIARKFPEIKVARMDSDTMRRGLDYQSTLESFHKGQIDVLIGTQMIAKGLDFPNVRMVGVISADTALHMPDFRAAERTFQIIAQVSGRAGRGDKPGIVVVQTFNAQDEVIQLAAKHDYESFAARELALRSAVELPPICRMARIVVRHQDHRIGFQLATELAEHLNVFNQQHRYEIKLHGPMPCPISRIAGFFRHQIELVARDAAALQGLMTDLRNAKLLHADGRTAVDVDPVELM